MNRRQFLGTSLGAAAVYRMQAASDEIQVGIIGVGGRGRSLLRSLLSMEGVRVRFLCDPDQASLERAQAILKERNAPAVQTTADMRRVLDDPSIDAVFIATPDH